MVPTEIRLQLDTVRECRPGVDRELTKSGVAADGHGRRVCKGKHNIERLALSRRNLETTTRIRRGHDRRGVGHFKLEEEANEDEIGASGCVATRRFTGPLGHLQIGEMKARLVLLDLYRIREYVTHHSIASRTRRGIVMATNQGNSEKHSKNPQSLPTENSHHT
jgi:hypothetical protein